MTPKFPIRAIAVLLVPCFIADPALAAALSHPQIPEHSIHTLFEVSVFKNQAFELPIITGLNPYPLGGMKEVRHQESRTVFADQTTPVKPSLRGGIEYFYETYTESPLQGTTYSELAKSLNIQYYQARLIIQTLVDVGLVMELEESSMKFAIVASKAEKMIGDDALRKNLLESSFWNGVSLYLGKLVAAKTFVAKTFGDALPLEPVALSQTYEKNTKALIRASSTFPARRPNPVYKSSWQPPNYANYVVGEDFNPEEHGKLHRVYNSMISMEYQEFPYDDEAFHPGNPALWHQVLAVLSELKPKIEAQENVAIKHYQPTLLLDATNPPIAGKLLPRDITELKEALEHHGAVGVQFGLKKIGQIQMVGDHVLTIDYQYYYNDWGSFSEQKIRITFNQEGARIIKVEFSKHQDWVTLFAAADQPEFIRIASYFPPNSDIYSEDRAYDVAIHLTHEGPKVMIVVSDAYAPGYNKMKERSDLKKFPYEVVSLSSVERASQKYESLFKFENPSRIVGRASAPWVAWLYEWGKAHRGWTDRYIDRTIAPPWEALPFAFLFILVPMSLVFILAPYVAEPDWLHLFQPSWLMTAHDRFFGLFYAFITALVTVPLSARLFGSAWTHLMVREYPKPDKRLVGVQERPPTAKERRMLRTRGLIYGSWAAGAWLLSVGVFMLLLGYAQIGGAVVNWTVMPLTVIPVSIFFGVIIYWAFHETDNKNITLIGGIVGSAGAGGSDTISSKRKLTARLVPFVERAVRAAALYRGDLADIVMDAIESTDLQHVKAVDFAKEKPGRATTVVIRSKVSDYLKSVSKLRGATENLLVNSALKEYIRTGRLKQFRLKGLHAISVAA